MSRRMKFETPGHVPAAMPTVPIDQCKFNADELIILELIRFFCLSHASPDTQGWLSAFRRAEELFGSLEGPMLAHAASELVRAVQSERTSMFHFVDPRCENCSARIFPVEIAMMKLVRGAHKDDKIKVANAAKFLSEGSKTTETIKASYALGACLDCVQLTKRFAGVSGSSSNHIH